jgi:hypothetical protein
MKILLTLLFSTLLTSAICQEKYDIYLLIGQSNMAGRGKMIPSDTDTIAGVYLLTREGIPEPATNPLNKYSTIRKDISMQQISMGFSFAKQMYKKTGRKVLLVVNARGGSTIEEWDKSNSVKNYYSEAVRRTREAMRYGTLKAILWHQGEQNSENPGDYLLKLEKIVREIREDLNSPKLPFIVGEIARWWKPNATNFNPVINKISETIPYNACVCTRGAKSETDLTDPHFNRESQILIGKRYAREALKLIRADKPGRQSLPEFR